MFPQMRSAGLPRRLGAGLILLALSLQALAPAAALHFTAEAQAADALVHAIICGQDPGVTLTADLPIPVHADHDRCPFCRCTAAAPLPNAPEIVVRRVIWHAAAWPTPPPPVETKPPRSPARARAPPQNV
ncbi:hypothetical protein [Methylobacterium sp. GC_Met_2]|uniref:hypothetical protein n=1 Tax=Methylobacterium sp. GC_Met_2 TaxID=2937376 RepID=UPI00226BB3AC|nr:hypothetical protein [Methylobacterium sp. GC_Met_2]